MQRAIPKQLLGIGLHYYPPEKFHFVKLTQDLPSSLARRAGMKSYDRVVFFNGINIANDSFQVFSDRFDVRRDLPVQMLVCDPATYAHYKANNKTFRCDLPTVQHLKPVYATSSNIVQPRHYS